VSIVVLVQSRMGSSRLPGKALRILAGKSMVLHVLDRAASLGYPTWLATSLSDRDTLLAHTAMEAGYPVWRGSEWDVLGRMAALAEALKAETVMRLTGDCPLWAPDVGRRVLALYEEVRHEAPYVSNDTAASGWADGLDTEVLPAGLLHLAATRAMDRMDREHVTPWVRRHYPTRTLRTSEAWAGEKLSVDCIEDFERVQGVMAWLNGGGTDWPATRAAYERWRLQ
jgi:spore coat polysaccharide biosynthesis protein SpsF (cytidylyltransferase family)